MAVMHPQSYTCAPVHTHWVITVRRKEGHLRAGTHETEDTVSEEVDHHKRPKADPMHIKDMQVISIETQRRMEDAGAGSQ